MFDDLIITKKEEKAREIKRKYKKLVKTKEDENK
jgi:hypothetical protein